MRTKICKKCRQEKKITEFYKHAEMADGYLNICKDCVKLRVRKYRQDNIEKVRAYDRERPNAKERYQKQKARIDADANKKGAVNKAKNKWRKSNKNKRAAHNKVQKAISSGQLVRPCKCQICGKQGNTHAHHTDYSKPLDVIFVCSECHGKLHRRINEQMRLAS